MKTHLTALIISILTILTPMLVIPPLMPTNAMAPTAAAIASTVRLTYSINNAPAEIAMIAEALGIENTTRVVPPRLYTKKINGIRTFNRERAERNLEAIKAICDGARNLISDIEGPHRDHVRRPDDFSDAQVKGSVNQYVSCWSWFRSHFPGARIFEWNLTNSRRAGGPSEFAEQLVLKHLDGFTISVFYRDKANWKQVREEVVAHANSLVAGTNKIVIVGIHERHNVNEPGNRNKQAVVPQEFADAMVTIALAGDVVMLWSNIFDTQVPPAGDERLVTNALLARMMANMRLGAAGLNE